MQNQSMMTPGAQFLSTWLQLDSGTGRNAVATEGTEGDGWEKMLAQVRRSPLNVSKDVTPEGYKSIYSSGEGRKKLHKANGVKLQLSLSFFPFLCPSLFSSLVSLCICVFLHFLRLSRVALLKCPFLLANQADQNGYWPTNSYHIFVCVCFYFCVC